MQELERLAQQVLDFADSGPLQANIVQITLEPLHKFITRPRDDAELTISQCEEMAKLPPQIRQNSGTPTGGFPPMHQQSYQPAFSQFPVIGPRPMNPGAVAMTSNIPFMFPGHQ